VRKVRKSDGKRPVTLKIVADYVGLAAGTVSAVLNDTAAARAIPQRTKDRVLQAAAKLNYHPNPVARALRVNRTPSAKARDANRGPGTLMFVGAEYYLRAIQAIRGAGLRVPGDVSIVGVHNSPSELDRLPS
jgi:DNA-binding LacI/PurR family transcriptional regulator